jgi:hypothetical protein
VSGKVGFDKNVGDHASVGRGNAQPDEKPLGYLLKLIGGERGHMAPALRRAATVREWEAPLAIPPSRNRQGAGGAAC